MSLRYKWLKWRGYIVYTVVSVAHSWDGEVPPVYGYYTKLRMRKGASFKEVSLRKATDPQYVQKLYERGEI